MSNIVDPTDPHKNLFGCDACPNCTSDFREPRDGVIHCCDCGFEENAIFPLQHAKGVQ